MSHPTLEFLGLRLPRAHNQFVQARLADDEGDATAVGANLPIWQVRRFGHFILVKVSAQVFRSKFEDVAYVLGDEPRLPRLIGQGAQ